MENEEFISELVDERHSFHFSVFFHVGILLLFHDFEPVFPNFKLSGSLA
ncbi:hypothetical protein [Chryseobacterium indologenes]|nr:hypothetical protein [Chryseobacterium indologenes]